jgi:hypothetical protein
MNVKLTCLTAVAVAASSAVLIADPASAGTVNRYASCSTSTASVTVTFSVNKAAGRYGTLVAAQGSAEGEFTDDPAMTVRVRDGYGKLIVAKTSTDGSLSLSFARRIGGPNWTAEATLRNTASGPCTTPRRKIAVI